eukprot:6637820-Prymnesium_polylepis.1
MSTGVRVSVTQEFHLPRCSATKLMVCAISLSEIRSPRSTHGARSAYKLPSSSSCRVQLSSAPPWSRCSVASWGGAASSRASSWAVSEERDVVELCASGRTSG